MHLVSFYRRKFDYYQPLRRDYVFLDIHIQLLNVSEYYWVFENYPTAEGNYS